MFPRGGIGRSDAWIPTLRVSTETRASRSAFLRRICARANAGRPGRRREAGPHRRKPDRTRLDQPEARQAKLMELTGLTPPTGPQRVRNNSHSGSAAGGPSVDVSARIIPNELLSAERLQLMSDTSLVSGRPAGARDFCCSPAVFSQFFSLFSQ